MFVDPGVWEDEGQPIIGPSNVFRGCVVETHPRSRLSMASYLRACRYNFDGPGAFKIVIPGRIWFIHNSLGRLAYILIREEPA